MHLFDAEDKLKKYSSVFEIMDDYFGTRLQMYQTRKDFLVDAIQKELVLLSNKAKYLEEVLSGVVDLRRKTRAEVGELLSSRDYNVVEEDMDFKYLTKMPMDSVTSENVLKLNREFQTKQGELEVLKITSDRQMWIQELSALTSAYSEYKQGRERLQAGGEEVKSKKRSATKSNVVVNKKVKPLEVV